MSTLVMSLLVIGIVGGIALLLFLIFGLQPLIRYIVKSTGKPATATILDKQFGRWVMYSGSEYNRNVTAQQVILKLEVHPTDGVSYVAQDKFMAKAIDLMRLNQGCEIDVYIARNNPQRVVCLPKSVTAPANAPIEARAGLGMANLAEQMSKGGWNGTDQILNTLQEQGILQTGTIVAQDDPKAKIEMLKNMLDSGLITQQEFEAKKKEILARM